MGPQAHPGSSRLQQEPAASASTGEDGVASFSDLAPGIYRVTAAKSVGSELISGSTVDVAVRADAFAQVTVEMDRVEPDLLPLAQGNVWRFDRGDSMTVGPTVKIDGLVTYALIWNDGVVHFGYLARGAEAVYLHGVKSSITEDDVVINPPGVWLDTAADALQSWEIRGWGRATLETKRADVETGSEFYTDCWRVRFEPDEGEEFKAWFKAGIGFVKVKFGSTSYLLSDYELH
jgi:hypothetical protein